MITNSSTKPFRYNGLTIELHPDVYEPAEDTFQILEAIKIDDGDIVFEIGTGCGIIALECARRGATVICSDINPRAVELAQSNYARNKLILKGKITVRRGDLFSVLKPDETFDIVIFNPPYLPTSPDDRLGGNGWFDRATDGGSDGLAVIERFIKGLPKYMRNNGRAYFVFSSLADRNKLTAYISNAGLRAQVVLGRWFHDEQLDIYCIYF